MTRSSKLDCVIVDDKAVPADPTNTWIRAAVRLKLGVLNATQPVFSNKDPSVDFVFNRGPKHTSESFPTTKRALVNMQVSTYTNYGTFLTCLLCSIIVCVAISGAVSHHLYYKYLDQNAVSTTPVIHGTLLFDAHWASHVGTFASYATCLVLGYAVGMSQSSPMVRLYVRIYSLSSSIGIAYVQMIWFSVTRDGGITLEFLEYVYS